MTAVADPFADAVGIRRGAGLDRAVGDRAQEWAHSFARFEAEWDACSDARPEPVTDADVAHSSLHAVHALTDLNDLLVRVRGEGVRADDFEFVRADESDEDLVVYEMYLYGANVAGLVADVAVHQYDDRSSLHWYLSPGHMLLFDDDPDGELTFITMVPGALAPLRKAFTLPAAMAQTRDWLLEPAQLRRARAAAAEHAARRVHRRLSLQGVDLVCPLDSSKVAA